MPLDVKAAVADALLELIRRKDADKITVKDLVEVCGISRQTFYYHFKDIVDVVEWAAQQGVQRLVRESLNAATPQEALGVFVDFAVESQPLVQRLLNSQRREAIERIMVDATRTYLADSLRERRRTPALRAGDWKIALDFYAYGMTGLLLENCRQRDLDRQELADQLFRLLSGEMVRPPETGQMCPRVKELDTRAFLSGQTASSASGAHGADVI